MIVLSSIIIIYIVNIWNRAYASGWTYQAVGLWADEYTECGFTSQSPIDITITNNSCINDTLSLSWTSQSSHYIIRNNGHSLQAIPFEIDDQGGDIAVLEALHHTNDTQIKLQNAFYDTYSSRVNKGMYTEYHIQFISVSDIK